MKIKFFAVAATVLALGFAASAARAELPATVEANPPVAKLDGNPGTVHKGKHVIGKKVVKKLRKHVKLKKVAKGLPPKHPKTPPANGGQPPQNGGQPPANGGQPNLPTPPADKQG
jgi:hypothetical protein